MVFIFLAILESFLSRYFKQKLKTQISFFSVLFQARLFKDSRYFLQK
jgi:hypothetical protein